MMESILKSAGIVLLMVGNMLLLTQSGMAQSLKDQSLSQMEKSQEEADSLQLKINGMSCQAGCANGIDKMLSQRKGILESKTTFDSGTSEIKYDKSKISEQEIIALIEKRGFKTEAVKEK